MLGFVPCNCNLTKYYLTQNKRDNPRGYPFYFVDPSGSRLVFATRKARCYGILPVMENRMHYPADIGIVDQSIWASGIAITNPKSHRA